MKLVTLKSKRWRYGRVSRDRIRFVGVYRDQHFLIDKKARPGHERAHPLAHAARQAEGHTISGDVMQHLAATP
jgi:hypothetical protein